MAKSRTGIDSSSLPDTTAWARAVVLASGLFGVNLSERSLSAPSLEELGSKVRDAARALLPAAKMLVGVLEARIAELGLETSCDRLITARSARELCQALRDKGAREVVELLASARLETSSSAVQASLGDATEVIETLEDPLVLGVLRQLASREPRDLSASKYVREARAILKQDEMRRTIPLELRMVAGAAQAYLLSGTPSAAEANAAGAAEGEAALPKSMAMASVVAPLEVRIEPARSTLAPPPTVKSKAHMKTRRSTLTSTLASEGVTTPNRVGIDRRGVVPNRKAARELLGEAVTEAEQKLASSKGAVLFTVVVTIEVGEG
jgi:hypothetical protein